jgi:predicted peptidase
MRGPALVGIVVLLGRGSLPAQVVSPADTGRFVASQVETNGQVFNYAVWLPASFDGVGVQAWPVVLVLHGAGSRGSDGIRQRGQSIVQAARDYPQRYPVILVLPQCPEGMRWEGPMLEVAMAALDSTLRQYRIDQDRIYLAGQSMGGDGAFSIASAHPDRFAAMVVAAIGRGTPEIRADRLRHLPVWLFHGELDPIPIAGASRRIQALEDAGSTAARFTPIPGAGHEIFDQVYRDATVPAWLFRQRSRLNH